MDLPPTYNAISILFSIRQLFHIKLCLKQEYTHTVHLHDVFLLFDFCELYCTVEWVGPDTKFFMVSTFQFMGM